MRIFEQLEEFLGYGIVFDNSDCLQSAPESQAAQVVDKMITKVSFNNLASLHKKYMSLGWKFKTLKMSYHKAEGDFLGMVMNFPYYMVFNNQLEVAANEFLCNPNEEILSKAWNTPGQNMLVKKGLELVSKGISTKRQIFFKRLFPDFNFHDIAFGTYKEKAEAVKQTFLQEMKSWDIFKPQKEDDSILKATYLSSKKMDKSSKDLPLSDKSKHTIILYSGGGGFLADLQMIQENFLKKWAKDTHTTVFQFHYRLCPKNRYPAQTNDVFNMYMQIVLYYKLVMQVKDLHVILMGDSAGGCIALSLMNVLAKLDMELPNSLCVVYPATDLRMNRFSPSMLHSFDDQLLYFTIAKSCFTAYVPEKVDFENDWLLSPGLAPAEILAKYPPTMMSSGEFDSLRDDCVRMIYKINKSSPASDSHPAPLKATFTQFGGLYHGFLGFQLPLSMGVDEVDKMHKYFSEHINKTIQSFT